MKSRTTNRGIVRNSLVAIIGPVIIAAAGVASSQASAAAEVCTGGCSTNAPAAAQTQVLDKKAPPKSTQPVTEHVSLTFAKIEFKY